MKNVTRLVLAGLASGLAASLPANANVVVVPNVNENVDGPSNQAFPFNANSDFRYQQVFAASQFMGKTGTVQQIAYRVDETTGDAFTSNLIDIEIRLSHTDAGPNNLSNLFAENIGPDETLVMDRSDLQLMSDGLGNFDIILDIDDVFSYNGVDNLLLDIKIFNGASTTQFDAAGLGLGQGGTEWTDRLWALNVNAMSGNQGGDDGMVTQFTIPGPGGLALIGLAGLLGRRRRR